MTTRTGQPHDKALDSLIAAKAKIDTILERLKALSDGHFETHPDEINWGHVGTLNRCRSISPSLVFRSWQARRSLCYCVNGDRDSRVSQRKIHVKDCRV
jgi:hypothetical protein